MGALSEYDIRSQSSTKKFKILILYLGYNGMIIKPSHATVPLNVVQNPLKKKIALVGKPRNPWQVLSHLCREKDKNFSI
jgi:hypothetical protein